MISVKIQGGKVAPEYRQMVSEYFGKMKDGVYYLALNDIGVWTGRYRYHFGYLLPSILVYTELRHQITKEFVTVLQLHQICKDTFNQQPSYTLTGQEIITGGSTRLLSDKQFFAYEERICEYFINKYGVELLTRSEWADFCKRQKKSFIQQPNSINNEL